MLIYSVSTSKHTELQCNKKPVICYNNLSETDNSHRVMKMQMMQIMVTMKYKKKIKHVKQLH